MSHTSPNQPGLTPPPGVTPDFDSPFTLQPYQALVVAACVAFTTTALIARLYTKARIIKAVVWEDYSSVIGWAAFMTYLGIQTAIGRHGGGTHQWNLLYKDVQYGWRLTNYGDMIYSLALFFTRLSILLLILRIFCSVKRDRFYWLTQFLIGVNAIFYILFLFIPIFLCSPRSKIWNPDEPGHCLNAKDLYLAAGVFNFISDIAMLSVPVFLIWTLQMSSRRKVGVSAIFCTGVFACIASVMRLIYTVNLTKTEDYTYVHAQTVLWAHAEIAFGLLCSCFVVLPRLYRHLADIKPVTAGTSAQGGPNRTAKISSPHGKRDWVPLRETKGGSSTKIDRSRSEEQALENAVDGFDGKDVEAGFGSH